MRSGLMSSRFFVFLCFSFVFCQFGIQNQSKLETVDGVAAVVENDVILKSDVMQQAYMVAQQQGVDPFKQPQTFESIFSSVLDQMVDNLVLYQVSLKDTNIFVDPLLVEESLKKEINKRIEFAGSANKLEDLFGEPLSMIRAKLRLEIKKGLRIERFTGFLYQETSPSVLDVKNFYNTFKDSLPFLENRVSFSVLEWPIVVDKNKEASVVSFLNNLKDSLSFGVSFSDLAKRHSEDVGSSSSGGALGFFVRGSLFPEYESVAFGLSVGEVSIPFKTEVGYHLVLLEDRVGEKIKTSHILKRLEKGSVDIEKSRNLLDAFLSEQDVYNSVEKFDSLCAHFLIDRAFFQGVFRNTPIASLPPFLQKVSLDSLGFQGPFLEKESLFVVRVFDYKPSEKITLENYYSELFGLTQNQLMGKKITDLINKEKETIYVKKFY